MRLPISLFFALITIRGATAQSATLLTGPASSPSSSGSAPTTTGANRITYAHLPSCASECIASAVRSVPCSPFVASCLCALPTGRLTYQLPEECVREKCGKGDIDAEESWRESVCSGLTSRTSVGLARASATRTAPTNLAAEVTEICETGWKGCPKGLNGGCCPSDGFCNLLDCQPAPVAPSISVTKVESPTEIPVIDIAAVFPPCSYKCITEYLPTTLCGLSPLNSTCFCQLHDLFPCISTCSEVDINKFVATHLEICRPLWYFKPYDPNFERWCDLVDGSGKRGRPLGYDERMGNLEYKCPDWWEQRTAGKRFGIVLGIWILSFLFIYGCCGYWRHVGIRVTEIDRRKAEEKRKLMGM